ncbi:MAG: SDR family oxidoreductase [Chloroflexota bacterium]
MKTVLITGSSSGIGRDTVIHFQREGWNVAATMRRPEDETELNQLENVQVLRLDATDRESIISAVNTTIETFGNLDVVINNAGYGLAGPLEAVKPDQLTRQYDTNVFGPIYVMQATLPHFRAQKSGLFINISSVGGRITLPFMTLYHGTKYALEGISEALNYELNPLGIRVKLVEPGGVKTDFAGRSLDMMSDPNTTDYDEITQKVLATYQEPSREDAFSTGADIAKVIFTAATDGTAQIRYPAGNDAIEMLGQRPTMSDEAYVEMTAKNFGL